MMIGERMVIMNTFKIGEKVQVIKTGEIGIVKGKVNQVAYLVYLLPPIGKEISFLDFELTRLTGNFVIDHHKDNSHSIEQDIEKMNDDYDFVHPSNYYDGNVEPFILKDFFKVPINKKVEIDVTEFITDHNVGDGDKTCLNKKWQKALKEAYINMALDTKDFEWLKQLIKEEK